MNIIGAMNSSRSASPENMDPEHAVKRSGIVRIHIGVHQGSVRGADSDVARCRISDDPRPYRRPMRREQPPCPRGRGHWPSPGRRRNGDDVAAIPQYACYGRCRAHGAYREPYFSRMLI